MKDGYYELDALEKLCKELKFQARRESEDELLIELVPGKVLVFQNMPSENDTLIGFIDAPWHSHGLLGLMNSAVSDIYLDEFEVLWGLRFGDLLIAEQYLGTTLVDRWLAHKGEPINPEDVAPGEEMRFQRLNDADVD